jgi:peptide deformylase
MKLSDAEKNKKLKEKGFRPPLVLIPPTDPRIHSSIAPFDDVMLAPFGYENRHDLVEDMFKCMKKYGGLGLSANQVGLPFRMFVCGDHPQIEDGKKLAIFNPVIEEYGEETYKMKEGCLSYPFLFLDIERPRKITAKHQDEHGDFLQLKLDGMISRIFQHEFDHMQGKTFVDGVSKLKLDMAHKKAKKEMKKLRGLTSPKK